MAIKHKFTSEKADDGDTTLIRPSNWNDTHDIDHGIATLDANGMLTIENAKTPTYDRIILLRQSGNSGMPIYVSTATEGVRFTIYSKGEQDDAGLPIPWFFL
jgi:hypothetical protein